ncbi:hypothetical protein ALC62_14061, partial [Cyphomyrmex costatus]
LPVISLPTFSRNYEQWQQFYDTFQALVHNNVQLDSIQKFHYLKSALSDSAAQVIHSLQTTNENYPIALELLTKRFQNLRLTIHYHVKELFDIPPIPKESAEMLRALSDDFQKHLRVLQQLKEPVDKWDTLIIYLVTRKLDPTTKKEWELKVAQEKLSTIKQLMGFLDTRCQFLEFLHPAHGKVSTQKPNQVKANKNQGEAVECALCKQAHRIFACKIFKELSLESRRNEVRRLNLCYNCLAPNRTVQNCTSRTCRHCSKKHHTLLHADERVNNSNKGSTVSSDSSEKSSNANKQACEKSVATSVTMKSSCLNQVNPEILLSTAMVYIRDDEGRWHKARALLDNRSQSFITKALYVNLLIVNQITRSIPTKTISIKSVSLPQCLNLADPTFYKPQTVDLLLGATIFWDVLETERIQLGAKQPMLQSTKLGWILCGQVGSSNVSQFHNRLVICGLVRNDELNAQVEKFWRIEDMPETKIFSKEEAKCEELFQNEHKRTADGGFEVALPFREDPRILGESKTSALKRLHHLERKFKRDPQLQERYVKFIDEYIKLGHMSAVPDTETTGVNYLPHHAVLKKESVSTKLRVVFDASCPTTSGKSLNDCLMVGPTIQPELFEILLRFRQHPYVLIGDIVKMYRQIMIKPDHRRYQCILWRAHPADSVSTFSLNTVTYGTASAPFSAIRSLQQLSFEYEASHPRAAAVISRDFYVDDMITGDSSMLLVKKPFGPVSPTSIT